MSFLGIVNSIGGDKAPPPPQQKPPGRPASANTDRSTTPNGRPLSRAGPTPLNGVKRRAEDDTDIPNGKASKARPLTGAGNAVRKAAAPPLNAPKPSHDKPANSLQVSTDKRPKPNPSTPSPVPTSAAKKPVPSSYADMIARAKEAQAQRAHSQVGIIKHQQSVKERTSKLAERRREEQARTKGKDLGRSDSRSRTNGATASPPKSSKEPDKKVSAAASKPAYKGTMGLSTNRNRLPTDHAGKSRMDEYLGTDEEDNSEMDDHDGAGDYGSDESSDMEAGLNDIDVEEEAALREARADDARELAKLDKLAREKEERRRRLIGLANKRK